MQNFYTNPQTYTAMNPLSILLVDDSKDTLDVLAMCLDGHGHEVTCVTSGHEAITLLAQRCFDLVLTDVLMPEVDGVQVIMAARQRCPGARVIAMTGGGDFFAAKYLLKMAGTLGADAQLAKPFTRQQLFDAIEAVCPQAVSCVA